jgi:hypothetical protein
VPGQQVDTRARITLRPKYPMRMIAEPRTEISHAFELTI